MNENPTDLTPGEPILVWNCGEKYLHHFASYLTSMLVSAYIPEANPDDATPWLHWSRP